MIVLPNPLAFDWDEGNRDKNRLAHDVTCEECEEVFRDDFLRISPNARHSLVEERYYAFGTTEGGRKLLISFTIRRAGIRPISARGIHEKEQKKYESEQ